MSKSTIIIVFFISFKYLEHQVQSTIFNNSRTEEYYLKKKKRKTNDNQKLIIGTAAVSSLSMVYRYYQWYIDNHIMFSTTKHLATHSSNKKLSNNCIQTNVHDDQQWLSKSLLRAALHQRAYEAWRLGQSEAEQCVK